VLKGGNCEFEATLILALLVYFDGHFSTSAGKWGSHY